MKQKAQMVYWKPELHAKLIAIAKAEQRSFSQVVNMTVEIALAKITGSGATKKDDV